VEKAKTTPDTYPMSVNGLVTGSNQKSNRDPLMDLSDVDVEEALGRLQKRGLVVKLTGGRVVRWKHELYEVWKVNKSELAVLAELLLRGAQTEGELRGRASRMEPIDDLDALRTVLKPLAERKLVVYLTLENRRGTMLTHGFCAPEEYQRLRTRHAGGGEAEAPRAEGPSSTSGPTPARPDLLAQLEETRAELEELRGIVLAMRDQLAALGEELRGIKKAPGPQTTPAAPAGPPPAGGSLDPSAGE
jgi:uncharacterized protein YceH (UPF0502 family)